MCNTLFRLALTIGVWLATVEVYAGPDFVHSGINTANRVEIVNIRMKHRCSICTAMVENTRSVLDTYFTDALCAGKIVFKTIDIAELKKHKKLDEAVMGGEVLVLRAVIHGTTKNISLTDFAFINRDNPKKFSLELKRKITKELPE